VEADRQLGRFLEGLRKLGLAEKTVLFVTSDHGEADTGGHPPEAEDGWMMPLVIADPGIRQGKRFPYAEQIDIVPTLCYLMGVKPPANADGRILAEALMEPPAEAAPRALARLKKQSGARPEAARKFLGIEQILQWRQHGTLEELMEYDRGILRSLRAASQ